MQVITIAEELANKVPYVELSCIECNVRMEKKNELLWNDILKNVRELSTNMKVEEISKMPAIAASRKAYKTCGKDPARYRLSAEALLRRVIKRGEIYQINNVVDLLNLVSITSGFSIGGYDSDKIEGAAEFGIGKKDEPYTGIGRGELNIEFMPVFRDEIGAFGTPTSDSLRTSVSLDTQQFLMIIVSYGVSSLITEATEMAVSLLKKYVHATNIELKLIKQSK